MKPTTREAMAGLIKEAREKIPFHMSFAGDCNGRCDECAYKRLEFLDIDLSDWDYRLKRGDVPNLGDVHALARSCKEVYAIVQREGIAQDARHSNQEKTA